MIYTKFDLGRGELPRRTGAEVRFTAESLTGEAVPIFLLASGLFFSFYLKWFWLRRPFAVLKPLFSSEKAPGEISPRRALATSLAGTLGVGNIVGVSAAITCGGAGAVFWMWFSALIAATLKYAETVLAVRHAKACGTDGAGTAVYIKNVLAARGLRCLGAFAACVFCVLCIVNSLGTGCIIQANAVAGVLDGTLGVDRRAVGVVLALVSFVVALGGYKRIIGVTSFLVPFMSVLFCIISFAAIASDLSALPGVALHVVRSAFDFGSVGAGVLGFFASRAVRYGTMRGLLSNEAGAGTSPMVHSKIASRSAAEQGFLGIAEVVIDTVFLCMLTAAVVLLGGGEALCDGTADAAQVTVEAYSALLGNWARYAMCACVLLFGAATIVCQAFYGLECVACLSHSPLARALFTVVFSLCSFIGAIASPTKIWTLSDVALGLMTLINVAVLLAARKEIRDETREYFEFVAPKFSTSAKRRRPR